MSLSWRDVSDLKLPCHGKCGSGIRVRSITSWAAEASGRTSCGRCLIRALPRHVRLSASSAVSPSCAFHASLRRPSPKVTYETLCFTWTAFVQLSFVPERRVAPKQNCTISASFLRRPGGPLLEGAGSQEKVARAPRRKVHLQRSFPPPQRVTCLDVPNIILCSGTKPVRNR